MRLGLSCSSMRRSDCGAIVFSPEALRQHLADNLAAYIGEPEVASHVPVGEAGVVKAQAMQDGGLQIIYVNGILGDRESQIVGLPDGEARPDAAAGQPHREAVGVMV